MPKLSVRPPKYRKHRASGQAVVTFGGKDFYLGPHGTKASHLEYDRLIVEWITAGRPLRHPSVASDAEETTVATLINEYRKFAVQYYRKDGVSTGTAEMCKTVFRLVNDFYGDALVTDFRPLCLEALQQKMIQLGQARIYVNQNCDRIKRMFRWGVQKELVPPDVLQRLEAVPGLRKGRTDARETDPVEPVASEVVDATLPFLPSVVADMARLQRLTGARPSEVCILRPCDVDRSGETWRYVPASHKTEHHGRGRVIFIGPKAQEVLRPYLLRAADAYCFRPCDSEHKRRAEQHAQRKTPLSCGNRPGTNRRRAPARTPGERYSRDSYRRAVTRAVELANRKRKEEDTEQDALPSWSPNQLRHLAATEIRRRFGLEAAQVILGHSKADVTQVYAERDYAKAEQVVREVG